MSAVLEQLDRVLQERRGRSPESSYVASLYENAPDAILKKIGEESAEVIMAARDGNNDNLVHEVADLWFHCLVLLAHSGLNSMDVLAELERRSGQSGLEEKAARKK